MVGITPSAALPLWQPVVSALTDVVHLLRRSNRPAPSDQLEGRRYATNARRLSLTADQPLFRAVVCTLVPEAAKLEAASWARGLARRLPGRGT